MTGAGGLALLAAGVLLFDVSGSTSLSAMASSRASIVAHPFYAAIAILMLLAAFTKSAQVPFHFWLPNAMAAPTPVSAYLHSATMVKAGMYLMARMTPILGATDAVDDRGHCRRRRDHGGRRLPVCAGDGSQTHPRLLDGQRARRLDDAARRRHTRGDRRVRWSTWSHTRATRAHCSWSPARSTTRPAHVRLPASAGCAGPCR